MKRLLFITIVGLFMSTISMAQELNEKQLALRSDLLNFLRVEGFSPEIDADDDIRFKYEGKFHYIRVYSADTHPMYISLFQSYTYSDSRSKDVVMIAADALNKYKGVKVLCFSKTFQIRSEMYLSDSGPLKDTFYQLLNNISSAAADLDEECLNVSSTQKCGGNMVPFLVTNFEVANVDKDNNIIQNYGEMIWDSKSRYLKPRITVKPFTSSGTYTIYVKLYNGSGVLSTGTTSPAGYSYSTTITLSGTSPQTFALSGWGSDTSGNWSIGEYRFEIWYEGYCLGSKTFKVI